MDGMNENRMPKYFIGIAHREKHKKKVTCKHTTI